MLIYDSDNPDDISANRGLARKQLEKKVEVRFLASKTLETSSYYNTLMNTFSTTDIMVVDNDCLFTAFTNDKNNTRTLRNGKIMNDPAKIQLARDYFDKLWNEAETMAVFAKKSDKVTK